MPSPPCHLCGLHNSIHHHGLCYGCWWPEAGKRNALRQIRLGSFHRGFRELRHANRSLRVRDRENAKRSFLRAKRPALFSHPLGRKILLIWAAMAGEAIAMLLLFRQLGLVP